MPLFANLQSKILTGSQYGYSGTRVQHLGASEYTLVCIAADVSGSVHHFLHQIETCIQETVRACHQAPRADNLMLRLVQFESVLKEVHGFKPLIECKPKDYKKVLRSGGCTALYDASHNAVTSVADYGRELVKNGLSANAILFVITDGCDNASKQTPKTVARAVAEAVTDEQVESVLTVLVGVNVTDQTVAQALMKFSTEAGFDHYLELKNANASTLARLADFISRSIAAQSQVLGSGHATAVLTF